MKLSKEAFITKIHLVISVIIVIPVSFIYGFKPSSQFDISLNTVDEKTFLKLLWVYTLVFQYYGFLEYLKQNF